MTSTNRIIVHCTFCERPYNYDIPEEIPKNARIYCKDCKKQFRIRSQIATSQTSQKTQDHFLANPPQIEKRNDVFIDNPDELLLNTAIRELNKPNPDPRWANILISCKKENISTKSEVLEQFKQLNTQTLVNLLSKNLQEE